MQAGGGKSFASLLHHMKYIHLPNYKGITIRRTTPMLRKPGAIWDEAKSLYRDADPDARIRDKEMKITFGPVKDPTKRAEVTFTHFERVDDTDNFQGSQLSSACLDELCQFEESQFLYIMSRLRTKADMKPVMRATMNPGPGTWVHKWVEYYLYPEGHELHGRPDPEKQAQVRWFIRQGEDMRWRNSRQELFDEYGVKDEFGKLLPDDHKDQIKPLSFAFIAASVYDNPHVAPSYITFLEGLGRVDKEILLHGNWEARAEGSSYFLRSWCTEVTGYDESQIVKIVRSYDTAGTLKSEQNPSPDYTVSVKMAKMRDGTYLVLDVKRTRIRFGDWEKFIIENAMEDRELHREVTITLPIDPNPAAKAATQLMIRNLAEAGLYAQGMRASTSKLDRFRPFSAHAQTGGIKFLKGCGQDLENKNYNTLEFVYKELEVFDGLRRRGESGHDDIPDACSDAFSFLASKMVLPNFLGSIQNFQQAIGEPKVVSL